MPDSFADFTEDEGLEPESLGQTSDESPIEMPADDADEVAEMEEYADEGEEAADSDEVVDGDEADTSKAKYKFTVFDAMLLISLLCITLATVLMVMELRDFGNFPFSFPWRTSEAG